MKKFLLKVLKDAVNDPEVRQHAIDAVRALHGWWKDRGEKKPQVKVVKKPAPKSLREKAETAGKRPKPRAKRQKKS